MAIDVPIGAMRHRITLSHTIPVRDGHGGYLPPNPTVLFARVPAAVQMMEEIYARTAAATIRSPISVKCRYHPGIKAGMTVTYHSFDRDRTLEIVSPPELDEPRRMMLLPCREIESDS